MKIKTGRKRHIKKKMKGTLKDTERYFYKKEQKDRDVQADTERATEKRGNIQNIQTLIPSDRLSSMAGNYRWSSKPKLR